MKYHQMLMLFSGNNRVSRFRLCHGRYTENDVDEAVELGLIMEIQKNDFNEPIYIITDLGKKYRDG